MAQKPKDLRREADAYFERGLYARALGGYTLLQRTQPKDNEVKLRIGICSFHTNELEQARKFLSYLVEGEQGTMPEACLYLGKLAHQQLQFHDAIKYYKQYLRLQNGLKENQLRLLADDIKRCAAGQLLLGKEKTTLVENLGDKINGDGDDFAPLLSPNNDEKLYFSSVRSGNVGGLRDAKGLKEEVFGSFATDMYVAKIMGGEWTNPTPLQALLNTPRHDVLLDFNEKGTVMYYYKGFDLLQGEIFIDTFKANPDDQLVFAPSFKSPLVAAEGDRFLQFFNDSTLLFSSQRAGGFGGFDLYMTQFRNDAWSTPKNLGARINTAYDEVCPFLAADGRKLYFSANTPQSMGGFDVFSIKFDDAKQDWTTTTNIGFPVNSAGDDLYFRLAKDGLKAFFSSTRKEGSQGGSDIYAAYFKSIQEEQVVVSEPLLFNEVSDFFAQQSEPSEDKTLYAASNTSAATPAATEESENKTIFYEFNPFYYANEDDILGAANVRQLNKLSRLLNDFPQLKIQLTAHTDPSDRADYDLFFSLQKAEKMADYLVKSGVSASAILLKSCGSNYPIAKNIVDGNLFPAGQKMNRRLDLLVQNIGNLPLRINIATPEVSTFGAADEGTRYRNVTKDLSYKVQVAAIKQMYKGDLLSRYSDASIEKNGAVESYLYTLGLSKTFAAAEQLRKELAQKEGITDAFVVPYVGGVRITAEESKQYQTAYADLSNYVKYLKNRK